MTVDTEQLLQDGGAPEYTYHNSVALCGFCGKKVWQGRISTKKCCPCTVNIACHIKQSITGCRSSWKGEQVSKTNIDLFGRWKSSLHMVPTAITRILCSRFPGTSEMVGQVFKFVWRLRWKIKVVCMSLSPFVSFQSRFVTYLLTFPHKLHANTNLTLYMVFCMTTLCHLVPMLLLACSVYQWCHNPKNKKWISTIVKTSNFMGL